MISPCWGRFSKMDPRADPRSVTMRGGPSPSVVGPCLLGSLGRRPYREGFARPVEGRRRAVVLAPSWLQVRIFSRFVCMFFAFWVHLTPSGYFLAISRDFFLIFDGFGEGLGRIWGGFRANTYIYIYICILYIDIEYI